MSSAGIFIPWDWLYRKFTWWTWTNNAYLQEDLGDLALFDYLFQVREKGNFPDELIQVYKKVLTELQKFQIPGSRGLNYSVCYPRSSFDRQSMQWDLSYFKYYFLKLADIPFNEQKLEDDYNTLIEYLLAQDTDYFLYRDFQSRNIMLKDGEALSSLTTREAGREHLQYDVASLLYDSKADIPPGIREELLEHYIQELRHYPEVDPDAFPRILLCLCADQDHAGHGGLWIQGIL